MSTTFLDPKHALHTVDGVELRFRPVTVKTAFKLRTVSKPIAKALSTLFGATSEVNQAQSVKQLDSDEGKVTEQEIAAIDPSLAKLRGEQREEALAGLLDVFMDAKNLGLLQALVTESLRDEEDYAEKLSLGECELPTFTALLMGLAKANFGALPDPLARRLAPLAEPAEEAKETETVGQN